MGGPQDLRALGMSPGTGLARVLLGPVGEVYLGIGRPRLGDAHEFIPQQDESPAVILVVLQEPLLPADIVRLLPMVPPDKALEPRRTRFGPTRPKERANVLQAIRPDREVDPAEDFLVEVDHPPEV